MLLAFIAGWILGSLSLYSYIILTAKESPHPECLDCREESCDGCLVIFEDQEQQHRLAA